MATNNNSSFQDTIKAYLDKRAQEDSLIFSAQIRGKRIETVEVSLKQLKVVQSRGLQNHNTEYHDRILTLMNKNMRQIKERLKPKKNGTKRDVTAAA